MVAICAGVHAPGDSLIIRAIRDCGDCAEPHNGKALASTSEKARKMRGIAGYYTQPRAGPSGRPCAAASHTRMSYFAIRLTVTGILRGGMQEFMSHAW